MKFADPKNDKKNFEIAKQTAWNEEEYYIALKKFDEINTLRTAERKGKEEGKKEKAIEMAKNALAEGLDIELISKLTNLSIEEIKKLIGEEK